MVFLKGPLSSCSDAPIFVFVKVIGGVSVSAVLKLEDLGIEVQVIQLLAQINILIVTCVVASTQKLVQSIEFCLVFIWMSGNPCFVLISMVELLSRLDIVFPCTTQIKSCLVHSLILTAILVLRNPSMSHNI